MSNSIDLKDLHEFEGRGNVLEREFWEEPLKGAQKDIPLIVKGSASKVA